jgi:hypothetical protein
MQGVDAVSSADAAVQLAEKCRLRAFGANYLSSGAFVC